MNHERPNETRAKEIVQRRSDAPLEHHDKYGGVDYLSVDGLVALEVTAVTDGTKIGAWQALEKSKTDDSPKSALQSCWIVFAPENAPALKTFVQRVQPLIAELESEGEDRFELRRTPTHMLRKGALTKIYQALAMAHVSIASSLQGHCNLEDPAHDHELVITLSSGGTASGSNAAIRELSDALKLKEDNSRKLVASGATHCHLFVWVNDNTSFEMARPLMREVPAGAENVWGLPTIAPSLSAAITELWVMHERTGIGWHWNGQLWKSIHES